MFNTSLPISLSLSLTHTHTHTHSLSLSLYFLLPPISIQIKLHNMRATYLFTAAFSIRCCAAAMNNIRRWKMRFLWLRGFYFANEF